MADRLSTHFVSVGAGRNTFAISFGFDSRSNSCYVAHNTRRTQRCSNSRRGDQRIDETVLIVARGHAGSGDAKVPGDSCQGLGLVFALSGLAGVAEWHTQRSAWTAQAVDSATLGWLLPTQGSSLGTKGIAGPQHPSNHAGMRSAAYASGWIKVAAKTRRD
jgi:hypothetical protein